MKILISITNVYFIGIGGIGMSALAKYYLEQNATVSGYDKTPTKITRELQERGVAIHYEDDETLLDKKAGLVIYTPAVPATHKELNWYKAHDYPLVKRSVVLGEITREGYNICIAGTHGKTTISILTAHILRASGYGCQAFLGGISVNYHTNYWNTGSSTNVMEADEYDRSFLQLSPDVALISAMDADHLDIYGSVENMREAFGDFAAKLKEGGLLLTRYGISVSNVTAHNHIRYSLQNDAADVYGSQIVLDKGGYRFTIVGKDWSVPDLKLNMGGMHNVENTVAAVTIAHHLGIEEDKIRMAVASFEGVKRRFEYIIDLQQAKAAHDTVYIDDYAHHPQELKALLQSVRSLFNDRWFTVVFQPHLYSRTRDFYREFAEVLAMANEVILLPVYPARELPIEGISSAMIKEQMESGKCRLMEKEELLQWLRHEYVPNAVQRFHGGVLVTAGAGDVDQLTEPIKKILLNA